MAALKVYTYNEAGAILGGDNAPLSERTIERMVDAGDLERIGERMAAFFTRHADCKPGSLPPETRK